MRSERVRKIGIIIAVILGSIMLLYLGGLLGQIVREYQKWLADGGMYGSNSAPDISIRLADCFRTTFSFDGLKGMAVVIIASAVIFLYLKYGRVINGGQVDDRNVRQSKQDTYGTAAWMSDKVIKEYLEVTDEKHADGIILGMKDRKVVCLPKNSMLNRHVMVFGASGTMKSRSVVRPTVYQALRRQESVILLDPKSELYHDTSNLFRENGYEVRVFNLKEPQYSDSCNFMDGLNGDALMAQVLTDTIIKNTTTGKPDHFWDGNESNLLKALILYVSLDPSRPEYDKNLPEVYKLITSVSEQQLHAIFDRLPMGHLAKAPYSLFQRASDSVRAGVISGLGTRLQVLQSSQVNQILSDSAIDLTAPGKQKCAFYIIVSDQQGSLDFLTALFFSSLFIRLVEYADAQADQRCKVPVNVILEELNNCGVIPEFGRKISTARSRAISVVLVAQSLPQLQNRYPNNEYSELMGNCDTQLLLGCTEEMTANYFSFRSGIMSVDVNSIMTSRKTMAVMQVTPEYRESAGVGKRPLQTPDEILRMPQDTVLVALRGQNVLKLKKFDYINHSFAQKSTPAQISEYKTHIVRKPQTPEPVSEKPVVKKKGAALYSTAAPPEDF